MPAMAQSINKQPKIILLAINCKTPANNNINDDK